MIEIYLTGGSILGVETTYGVMRNIMEDDFIKPDDFIHLTLETGSRVAVRRDFINMFCESEETV